MYSFSISTCAAAATEKVRTPESNPLFVRLFSGFCYFSPDTAPHNLIFAPVSNVRGNNYKKAARVPVSVSPLRPAQYFISDIKDAALVDNDWGRAGQSILSSGPWGVVKTWIENNCQMLKMPRDGAMEQKYILLSCRLATHWILWCKGWAFVGTPGYLLSDKTSENSELMRRKTSRREIYFVARIFSLKMLFSQQRLGIVFFSVLSVFYTDTHQCSEWKRKC